MDVVNRSSDTEEETMPLIIDFSIQEIEGGRRGELASLAGNGDQIPDEGSPIFKYIIRGDLAYYFNQNERTLNNFTCCWLIYQTIY